MASCLPAVLLAVAPAAAAAGAAAEPPRDPAAGRSIVLDVELDAPPAFVFALWSSPAGIRRFFAPQARIDPFVGGRYEVLFDPAHDPAGDRLGTRGARVLRWVEPSELAFEWKGRPEMVEMNVRPLPTWVELTFTPLPGGRTRLHLAHHGFGQGGGWDDAWTFFDTAWRSVLGALQEVCGEGGQDKRPAAPATGSPR